MRLIWKKYDTKFNFVMTGVGVGFFIGGVYGVVELTDVLRHPLAWLLAAIPFLFAIMGLVTILRQYQLWKIR